MSKGKFIVVEGVDGSGKSTAIETIVKYYEDKGFTVTTTREPGGTPGGEVMRELLKSNTRPAFDPMAEALIFQASRVNAMAELIGPALDRGEVVVCDRWDYSSRVYQCAIKGANAEVYDKIINLTTRSPDMVIYMTADADIIRSRHALRDGEEQDHLGKLSDDNLEEMDKHYRRLISEHPCNRIVDSSGMIEDTKSKIVGTLDWFELRRNQTTTWNTESTLTHKWL